MILTVGVTADEARRLRLDQRTLVANLSTPDELEAFLQGEPRRWEAILLGPAIERPLDSVRRIKLRHPDAFILIVAAPADAARHEHELLLTPLGGEPPRCVHLDEDAPRVIEAHLMRAKLRRRHHQVIRHANLELAERPEFPFRMPPLVERFLDAAPMATFLLAEDGGILHANKKARALLPDGRAGGPLVDALPVREPDALRALIERADSTRVARLTLAGEPNRTFDAVAAPATPVGDRSGLLLMLNDVSALVEVERERERQAEFERALLAAQSELGIGILVLDADNVAYANEAYQRLVGRSIEDLRSMPVFDLAAPDLRAHAKARHERRLRGEPQEEVYETALAHKDGSRVQVEVTARLLQGGRTILLVRDVRARNQMQRELDEARLAVAQADKLASMGSLVAGLAHEVRTPLTVVMNHVSAIEMLAERALSEEDPRAALRDLSTHAKGANDGVDRIRHLVRDLKSFMRGDKPQKVRAPLTDPIIIATRLFQATQRGKIGVKTRLDARGLVEIDPAQVQQILINLLQNAADASESGSAVEVETRDQADRVLLIVRDSGRGIDPAVRDRMFEPFVTSNPDGSGLGLAIVRRLAELHQARVEVESTLGVGTTFTLSFSRVA